MEKPKEEKHVRKPVVFVYKSKAGGHLYAFNMETDGGDMALGEDVESLVVSIEDVEKVISGEWKRAKVSVIPKEKEAEG